MTPDQDDSSWSVEIHEGTLTLLEIPILATIFLATISCLLPISTLFLLSLLLLFLKM